MQIVSFRAAVHVGGGTTLHRAADSAMDRILRRSTLCLCDLWPCGARAVSARRRGALLLLHRRPHRRALPNDKRITDPPRGSPCRESIQPLQDRHSPPRRKAEMDALAYLRAIERCGRCRLADHRTRPDNSLRFTCESRCASTEARPAAENRPRIDANQGHHRLSFHVLQLRADSQDTAGYSGDGSRDKRSFLVVGGNCRAFNLRGVRSGINGPVDLFR